MNTVGIIHTVPMLAGSIDDALAGGLAGYRRLHMADPLLLQTALREGVTDWILREVDSHVRQLAERGACAVLITCSSIGAAAAHAQTAVGIPVFRIDAPMAKQAVELATQAGAGGRVAVLAALDSTVEPTLALLEETAANARANVRFQAEVVAGAWEARTNGAEERANSLIATAIERVADQADAVVLAQASMAQAATLASTAVPVLTSPESGIAAFIAAVQALA
jgi:aspartate/glutamate racemase